MAVPEGVLCEHAMEEIRINGRTVGLSTVTPSLEGA